MAKSAKIRTQQVVEASSDGWGGMDQVAAWFNGLQPNLQNMAIVLLQSYAGSVITGVIAPESHRGQLLECLKVSGDAEGYAEATCRSMRKCLAEWKREEALGLPGLMAQLKPVQLKTAETEVAGRIGPSGRVA